MKIVPISLVSEECFHRFPGLRGESWGHLAGSELLKSLQQDIDE